MFSSVNFLRRTEDKTVNGSRSQHEWFKLTIGRFPWWAMVVKHLNRFLKSGCEKEKKGGNFKYGLRDIAKRWLMSSCLLKTLHACMWGRQRQYERWETAPNSASPYGVYNTIAYVQAMFLRGKKAAT